MNQLVHQPLSCAVEPHQASVSMRRSTPGKMAAFRLRARTPATRWLVSVKSGSLPASGAKTKGLVRVTVQPGVSTSQLAYSAWEFKTA